MLVFFFTLFVIQCFLAVYFLVIFHLFKKNHFLECYVYSFVLSHIAVYVLHSHPDHYSTSSKCSGVDMNTARLLFHRVVQQDHPDIVQQVSGHKKTNPVVGALYPCIMLLFSPLVYLSITYNHNQTAE